VHLVDPTYEERPEARRLAPRPITLEGATVGIISNGKAGTRPFFDHLERLLREEWRVGEVVRLTKGNYSAPAEDPVMAEAATWAALFAGIGD
jgi:hypothetical protein